MYSSNDYLLSQEIERLSGLPVRPLPDATEQNSINHNKGNDDGSSTSSKSTK